MKPNGKTRPNKTDTFRRSKPFELPARNAGTNLKGIVLRAEEVAVEPIVNGRRSQTSSLGWTETGTFASWSQPAAMEMAIMRLP